MLVRCSSICPATQPIQPYSQNYIPRQWNDLNQCQPSHVSDHQPHPVFCLLPYCIPTYAFVRWRCHGLIAMQDDTGSGRSACDTRSDTKHVVRGKCKFSTQDPTQDNWNNSNCSLTPPAASSSSMVSMASAPAPTAGRGAPGPPPPLVARIPSKKPWSDGKDEVLRHRQSPFIRSTNTVKFSKFSTVHNG